MLLAAIVMMALTRAEIIERMRAPVVTQADGLVKVYASCPEDVRREFQIPVARFAANAVETLYRAQAMRPKRFASAGIIIHLGDVRTNDQRVVAKVQKAGSLDRTRIYLENPATSDLEKFRLEIAKAFFRSVKGEEIGDEAAAKALRAADPELRVKDERDRLERWLAGKGGIDAESGITLMRKVIKPGEASRRDVLVFASRLFLYPETFDRPFCGRYRSLSFADALKLSRADPRIRLAAYRKSAEMVIFSGGRGDAMSAAGRAYCDFLLSLTRLDENAPQMLEEADIKLNVAMEEARRREEG